MNKEKVKLFEEIYSNHQGMVLQMCLGFFKGDSDVANDLLQEVFMSVWKNFDKFKGASSYKTWIYRIAVNTCLQYIKKEKREKTYPVSELNKGTAIETNEHEINPKIQKLYVAIGQLKKVDRLIIMMVLENQDYESIADVIGITPANVRVRIHRIKHRLHTLLKNDKHE